MEDSRTTDGKSALLSAYKRSTLWVKAYEDLRNPMEQVLDPSTWLRQGRDDKRENMRCRSVAKLRMTTGIHEH